MVEGLGARFVTGCYYAAAVLLLLLLLLLCVCAPRCGALRGSLTSFGFLVCALAHPFSPLFGRSLG